ncbi:MAG: glycoside hydrolase [Muribaculaceae bacterium]|nr:glycoside hydrolase [Muribaculaceae bacterium]
MKFSTRLMMSAVALSVAGAVSAHAAETKTITVSAENGSYATWNGSASWADQWISSESHPELTISSTDKDGSAANNFNQAITSGALEFYVGTKPVTTLTLTCTEGWAITALALTAVQHEESVSITVGSDTYTTSAAGVKIAAEYSVDSEDPVTIKFDGPNKGTYLRDFTVTLTKKEVVPGFATLSTTTITDGEFAPETVWYHFVDANGNYAYYVGSRAFGTAPGADYDPTYLWALTGDDINGYQIYNRAAGASAATGKGTINSDGTALTVGTSVYTVEWAEQTLSLNKENGTFRRADGSVLATNDWQGSITRSGKPSLRLGSGKNNMQMSTLGLATGIENAAWVFSTDEGYYVTAFSFDYERASGYGSTISNTLTVGNNSVVVGTEKAHAELSGLTANNVASFTYTGTNGHVIVLTDITATIRRGTAEKLGYEIFKYTGQAPYELCFRIPAITTVENGVHKGRIIAVNDYRYNGTQDIQNGNTLDIKISISDDNGKTWTEPAIPVNKAGQMVAKGKGTTEGENNANAHWDCAFGDACIVSDRESGKILMMSVGGPINFFRSTRNNPNQIVRWYSEDGGETWTDADCFTEDFLSLFDGRVPNGQIQGQFIGSGRIMQSRYIKVGDYYRIYAVTSANKAMGSGTSNFVMYSDDFGLTWDFLGDPMIPAVPTNGDEPKAEELPDGSVLLAARGQGGNRNFNIWRYTDTAKAEGKWDTHVNTNCGQGSINACNGEIMILPVIDNDTQTPTYLALQSFPYGGTRANVSLIYKSLNGYDEISRPGNFATWEGRYQVSNMGSAYSTMCWQHNETLGFLYEEETYGKCYTGVYRNLSLEEITSGRYSYRADTDGSVARRITRNLIEGRLEAEATAQPGKYVGQPKTTSSNSSAVKAAEAWFADPTVENYMKFNDAMINPGEGDAPEYIEVEHAGIYRITSAHNGTYSAFSEPRYMATDGTTLISTETDSDSDARWILLHKPLTTENWVIYNAAAKKYVAKSPAQTETAFSMTSDLDNAGVYRITSDADGYSVLDCTTPGHSSYPAIHLSGQGNMVIWTSVATASRWYLEMTDTATELPSEFEPLAIDEITAAGATATLFDLMGRPVAVPTKGIYVTSDGRKIIR